jgi:hypothetical protein
MAEEISLSIRKLLENTSFYLIVGQTKTRKLLLTGLKTKHNVIVLTPRHTILHPTVVTVQHPFQHYKKKVLYVLVILWQESSVAIKMTLYHHLLT